MHDELLAAFNQWIEEHSDILATNQILVELAPMVKQTPKPAQYADFIDSMMHRFVGRVTLWSSGECDLEASATEDTTDFAGFFEHTIVRSAIDLERVLNQYMQRLRQLENRD